MSLNPESDVSDKMSLNPGSDVSDVVSDVVSDEMIQQLLKYDEKILEEEIKLSLFFEKHLNNKLIDALRKKDEVIFSSSPFCKTRKTTDTQIGELSKMCDNNTKAHQEIKIKTSISKDEYSKIMDNINKRKKNMVINSAIIFDDLYEFVSLKFELGELDDFKEIFNCVKEKYASFEKELSELKKKSDNQIKEDFTIDNVNYCLNVINFKFLLLASKRVVKSFVILLYLQCLETNKETIQKYVAFRNKLMVSIESNYKHVVESFPKILNGKSLLNDSLNNEQIMKGFDEINSVYTSRYYDYVCMIYERFDKKIIFGDL